MANTQPNHADKVIQMAQPMHPPADKIPRAREGRFVGEQVIANLMDGRTLEGGIEIFDTDLGKVVLQSKIDLALTEIPFQQLRFFRFVDTKSLQNGMLELGGKWVDLALGKQSTPFQLTFIDDQKLSGGASGSVEESYGLFIFHLKNGHVHRLFFPAQTLKNWQLGKKIGEALVEDKHISEKELQIGIAKQNQLRGKKVGSYLAEMVSVSAADLNKALKNQAARPSARLGDLLIEEGVISQSDLDKALVAQRENRSKKLGTILIDQGHLTEEELEITLARNLGIPFVRLDEFEVVPEVVALIPVEKARDLCVMPLFIRENRLVTAMTDPLDSEALNLIRFASGHYIDTVIATRADIESTIEKYYGKFEQDESLEDLELEALEDDQFKLQKTADIQRQGMEKPIVRMVHTLIREAIDKRTSDIHIRAESDKVALLYRIDGALQLVRTFNKQLLAAVISRIKIIGKMNIAERRLPQDGQTRVAIGKHHIDLRISTIPTVEGESVVIRILDPREGLKSIQEIGFNDNDQNLFKEIIHRTYGLLLVTGPTGSGKSTTLYAALREIRRQNLNIITVEDPVEYQISGVQQIKINSSTGYTFATALRHILRHDPDVIMIGEMRDEETAAIGIKSAMTGHLVLSTLHTNDAVSTVSRLVDMNIAPYLLASTLIGILSQRLIRLNCEFCLQPEEIPDEVRSQLSIAAGEQFYLGSGCPECQGTGYRGRQVVYELLNLTDTLRKAISDSESLLTLKEQAIKDGMVPLTENALNLARHKLTSLAEVYRIRLQ